MKTSVIVAVYNAAGYLAECLDSLLTQTHQDWEAWCVNDGSNDSSAEILDRYAMADSRINVVHLDRNMGLAHARNTALSHCTGEVIAFLDSDDWLSNDALEQACRTFDRHPAADCVLFDVMYCYPNRKEAFDMPDFETIDGKTAFVKSLTWEIHGIYAVRSNIHRQWPYDETARWYSDENVTRMHYLHSREVSRCSGTYFYRQHQASITHAVDVRHFDMLESNDSMLRQIIAQNIEQETVKKYAEQKWLNLIDCYKYYFVNRKMFGKAERHAIIERIRKAWESTDTTLLTKGLKRHFGYIPLKGHWQLFLCQMETYFMLRHLTGRNQD